MKSALRIVRTNRDQFYDEGEVANVLHIALSTVRGLVSHGLLNPMDFPGTQGHYFLCAEVHQLQKGFMRGDYFRTKTAAQIIGVNLKTIEMWRKTGKLQCLQLSKAVWIIPANEVWRMHRAVHRHEALVQSGEYLPIRQASEDFGFSCSTLRTWCKTGILEHELTYSGDHLIGLAGLKRMYRLLSPEYVGLNEAAALLGVHKVTVWRWTKAGRLHPVPVTKKWKRYRRDEVDRIWFLRRQEWLTVKQMAELLMADVEEVEFLASQCIITSRFIRGNALYWVPSAEPLLARSLKILAQHQPDD